MTAPDVRMELMAQDDWLAERFEEHRGHLRAVAYRMLGSPSDADDAVQEAWIRLSRSDSSAVENLRGWLTTVVGRVALDMLRSRTRREEPVGEVPALPADHDIGTEPERAAELADSLGPAMLVVLETLSPAERIAFVLHDMFAVPFDEIAPIVGRSPAAARQLASRARRRVQGVAVAPDDRGRSRRIVEAFLAASRNGDFDALLALLDPDVVLSADAEAVRVGASELVRGAGAVAGTFSGRARAAQLALIDGQPGAAWAPGGTPRVVFSFTVDDDKITAIQLLANSARLGELHLVLLDD
jgi:RNA polymerase sigma factor (sigma-70 family)